MSSFNDEKLLLELLLYAQSASVLTTAADRSHFPPEEVASLDTTSFVIKPVTRLLLQGSTSEVWSKRRAAGFTAVQAVIPWCEWEVMNSPRLPRIRRGHLSLFLSEIKVFALKLLHVLL